MNAASSCQPEASFTASLEAWKEHEMSILTTIERIAHSYSEARARYLTERAIQRLPAELQKDIGWPDPMDTRPDRRFLSQTRTGNC
jgi:hypothetical protein